MQVSQLSIKIFILVLPLYVLKLNVLEEIFCTKLDNVILYYKFCIMKFVYH